MPDQYRVPTAKELERGLLTRNYFPRNAKDGDELPPSFSSSRFSAQISKLLTHAKVTRDKGFDSVQLDLTRFNLVPRRIGIPHPVAYARLVTALRDEWTRLSYVAENPKSQFRPTVHEDGRITAMNYGTQVDENAEASTWAGFAARFRATADISNFYPSIYTHAIGWALVGPEVAKANTKPSLWYNKIDKAFRDTNRGETTGLLVGPGTSAIGAELILARVDGAMTEKYIRYIDDFAYYSVDQNSAEQFVMNLTKHLAKYNLRVSPGKTIVEPLPLPERPEWVRQLLSSSPGKRASSDRLLAYLDDGLELSKEQPDASALKWVTNHVLRGRDLPEVAYPLAVRLFKLAFHNPVVLPGLSRLFKKSDLDPRDFEGELNSLAQRHAEYGRSDGMAWVLHIMRDGRVPVSSTSRTSILETQDCLAITSLLKFGTTELRHEAVVKAREIVKAAVSVYDLDRYWLLLYEAYRLSVIANPYPDDSFELMKAGGVTFVRARARPPATL